MMEEFSQSQSVNLETFSGLSGKENNGNTAY